MVRAYAHLKEATPVVEQLHATYPSSLIVAAGTAPLDGGDISPSETARGKETYLKDYLALFINVTPPPPPPPPPPRNSPRPKAAPNITANERVTLTDI
nr:unnamed protein product [Spirometra erinaceieuropaei]